MSLISEALKEAQREHTVRKGRPTSIASVDNFFPYPSGKKRKRPNFAILVGGIAVVVLAAAGATYARLRLNRVAAPVASPPFTTSVAGNVVPANPSSPAIQVAGDPTVVASAPPATAAGSSIVPEQHYVVVPNTRVSAPTASAPTATAPTLRAPTSVAAATPDSTTPRAAPVARAPTLTNESVRIVVDPVGRRPADSLFQLAYAAHLRNDLTAAQELYERAIALPQAPAGAFNNYGALLAKHGNQAGAREMFQQALTRDPANVDAWVNLGDSYNAIGHHGEAMAAFARAAQIDPASSAVKIRLAAEYRAIGDTSSARRMYEDASRLAPRDPAVHYSYAEFLQSQHDMRGAIREYQQFVDLAPGVFGAETIDGVKQYIASLRRVSP
jgi:Tfp pilus assembly protein PilF